MLALPIGCGRLQERPMEAAEIKSNYMAFRDAIPAKDFDKGREFISSGFAKIYSPDQAQRMLDLMGRTNVITRDAYVQFETIGKERAWLWPQSRPVLGSSGIGFVKETNRWKIEGDFKEVQD